METIKSYNHPMNEWKMSRTLPLQDAINTRNTEVVISQGVIGPCFWFVGLFRWRLIVSIVVVLIRQFHSLHPFIVSLARHTAQVAVVTTRFSLRMHSA